MRFFKKTGSLMLILLIVSVFATVLSTGASAADITLDKADGADYTASPALARKLNDIFDGTAEIVFSDGACTEAVNTALGEAAVPAGYTRYVPISRNGRSMSGESCFIYASGVYAYLFGDYPGWDDMRWHSTEYTEYNTLTYEVCKALDVTCGTYVRAWTHSFIILSYDKSGLTVLNANYNTASLRSGTVSLMRMSWAEATGSPAFGQGLEHIVIPDADYYAKLYPVDWKDPRNAPELTLKNVYGGVQVSWKATAGATGYTLYSKIPGDAEWTKVKTFGAHKRSYVDTTVENDVFYLYMLRANRGQEKSAYVATPVHYLDAPELKTAAVFTDGSVKVTWAAVKNARFYTVYRKEAGETKWQKLGKTTAQTYTDETAESGVSYRYTVTAGNRSAVSGYRTVGLNAVWAEPAAAVRDTVAQ